MKLYRFKIILLHMMAFAAGYTSIFSCYPFSVAFFAAAYASDRFRYTIFPTIMIGMCLSAQFGQLIKYAGAILLTLLLTNILESRKKRPGRWMQGMLAAASLLALAWMLQENLYSAAGEAILILSLTVMFSLLIDSFLVTNVQNQEAEIIHGPGKAKLEESAEVFRRLAGCYTEMPHRQTAFTSDDRDRMSRQMREAFCTQCSKCLECWEQYYYDTLTTTSGLFAELEEEGDISPSDVKGRMSGHCVRLRSYLGEMKNVFEKARSNLLWYNRLIENRQAVAGQLTEMADMMTLVAEDIYDTATDEDLSLRDRIDRSLRRKHIVVKKTSLSGKKDGRQEIYITMHTRGNCISTREIARYISDAIELSMIPHRDSRRVLTGEDATVTFVEDTAFRVLHGVAKAIRPGEQVSGDNLAFIQTDDGQAVGCISDGMGCGAKACRESELVIELLERFLEAGFGKETTLNMINSTMVLTNGEPSCSTIDVCAVDLYTGVCEFLKLGAAASYIKRDHWVECVRSESLPVGVMQRAAYDGCSKKLFDGDFVVMVSDGVTEVFEETSGGSRRMSERDQVASTADHCVEPCDAAIEAILHAQNGNNPKEIANAILTEALVSCNYNPPDDMTVLVMGIWKK